MLISSQDRPEVLLLLRSEALDVWSAIGTGALFAPLRWVHIDLILIVHFCFTVSSGYVDAPRVHLVLVGPGEEDADGGDRRDRCKCFPVLLSKYHVVTRAYDSALELVQVSVR